jgi:hypothetical protein
MTAEVVVMNTSAIAMAADTAVSVPYRTGTKTYTRARKLLPLHETQPVAVMVWDAPGYFALPWEVIVGEFRRENPEVLNKLDDYVEAFFQFVDEQASKWVAGKHEIALLGEVLNPEIQLLNEGWNARLHRPDHPSSDAEIVAMAAEVARAFAAKTRQRYLPVNLWTGREASDLEQFDAHVKDLFNNGAEAIWRSLDRELRAQLIELGRERMLYIIGDEPGSSGLLFAGYGNNELFAQARVWRVNGRVDSMTRRVRRNTFSVSTAHPSLILPVAQEGVIHSFLTGLHPEVNHLVGAIVDSLTSQFADGVTLAQQIKDQFDAQVSRRGDEVARAVEFLPPDDLAMVAGGLIHMTALRNRATITADTVGGPIDLLLLSRADGIRWIQPADGFRLDGASGRIGTNGTLGSGAVHERT